MDVEGQSRGVLVIFNDEQVADLYIEHEEPSGVAVVVSKDDTVMPEFMLGVMALALQAMLDTYMGERRLPTFWYDIRSTIADALDFNEIAIRHALGQEGIDVDGS